MKITETKLKANYCTEIRKIVIHVCLWNYRHPSNNVNAIMCMSLAAIYVKPLDGSSWYCINIDSTKSYHVSLHASSFNLTGLPYRTSKLP
jgi:hypothetical protein